MDKSVSLVLISRDHEHFVNDCIHSVYREFGRSVQVIHVDTGSRDASVEVAALAYKTLGMEPKFIRGRMTTMAALLRASDRVSSDYVALLSTDDWLMPGYGAAVHRLLAASSPLACWNFGLAIYDEDSKRTGSLSPRWTPFASLNRSLLSWANLGTAPGSLIPWKVIRSTGLLEKHASSVVEDYPIWLELVSRTPIRSLRKRLVAYRRHKGAQSLALNNTEYAWSLGYVMGLVESRGGGGLSRLGLHIQSRRRLRDLDCSVHHYFREGLEAGSMNGLTLARP